MRYEIFYVMSLCTVLVVAIKLNAVNVIQSVCLTYQVFRYVCDYSCRHFSFGSLASLCFCAAMLDEDEEDRVDETALHQLTEMGFPESRAIKALRLNQ